MHVVVMVRVKPAGTLKVIKVLFFFSQQQIQELEATLYNALQQDKVLHVKTYYSLTVMKTEVNFTL